MLSFMQNTGTLQEILVCMIHITSVCRKIAVWYNDDNYMLTGNDYLNRELVTVTNCLFVNKKIRPTF